MGDVKQATSKKTRASRREMGLSSAISSVAGLLRSTNLMSFTIFLHCKKEDKSQAGVCPHGS